MKSTDPTVRRQELGEELRALRTANSFSLDQAARVINASPSRLSRLETGHRNAPIEDIASLLGLYRADHKQRARILALAREADKAGWLQSNRPDFAEHQRTLSTLESKAERIVNFEPVVVPGLLQTGEYTQSIMAESGVIPDTEIDDRMMMRLRRHSVLMRRNPPHLVAVMDEAVLHKPIGGQDVLRRQLEQLLKATARHNVTIRIAPSGCVVVNSPFTLLHLRDRSPVAVVENLTSTLFLEQPEDIDIYQRALDRLDSCALDGEQSRELIAELANRLDAEASTECAPSSTVLRPGERAATADPE